MEDVEGLIIDPFYDPYYVVHGSDMTLTCSAGSRLKLEWLRETPASGFERVKIVPEPALPFILRFGALPYRTAATYMLANCHVIPEIDM